LVKKYCTSELLCCLVDYKTDMI